jgi:hypothetical protein
MQEKYKQEIGRGGGNSGFFEPATENRKRAGKGSSCLLGAWS